MRRPRNAASIAAVALLLGVLVVIQIRAQGGGAGLEALSSQDLTVLVANLNTRNDQLRTEIATLDQQLRALAARQARGETSVGQLQADLARLRVWAGLDAVSGPGVRITVGGPIDDRAIEELLNELRNAGAEAIAVERVRAVAGTVVTGEPGLLSVEGRALPDPFEISVIGNAETLTGTLTRAGGVIAQLGATDPDAQLTVTPVSNLLLPATNRTLTPVHGRPDV
jgi:uncharacterized protein YlxW (UPF0749 family)